ncbi:MAG: ubiquinol-cytochrome C chaperone family protein [Sphingorhabdus sp.]
MSLLQRLFGNSGPDPKLGRLDLYNQVVAKARGPHWYVEGQVPDTVDGRFDMVAIILTLVLLRLEQDNSHGPDMAHLTELFVDDMDGQLRELGIGDMIVGKHIGKMMGSLGGRLGAFRDAMVNTDQLDDVILRNLYRGDGPDKQGLAHVRAQITDLVGRLEANSADEIVKGSAQW